MITREQGKTIIEEAMHEILDTGDWETGLERYLRIVPLSTEEEIKDFLTKHDQIVIKGSREAGRVMALTSYNYINDLVEWEYMPNDEE